MWAPPRKLEEDRAATVDPVRQALGWRYITLQIADIDTVHNDLRSKGVREGLAPVTLGNVARISMILDRTATGSSCPAEPRSWAVCLELMALRNPPLPRASTIAPRAAQGVGVHDHDGCYIAQCPNERKPIFSMRAIY
ncbi:MAG TPA: hypothetical protein VNY29_00760 [Terriglobales bacterium]|nr:hypothetical protein [Terriglobales bacterium]